MSDSSLLLISAASDYQAAVAKGNVSLLEEFDEGGFFARVTVAFPLAPTSRTVHLSEGVIVRDIGWDWIPGRRPGRVMRRLLAPLHFLRTVCILMRHVVREKIDVIRATDPILSGAIAWVTARSTGRPFCVSIHADLEKRQTLGGQSAGTDVLGSRGLARRLERFVLIHADMVMPIRESLRDYALSHGARPDRVRVIPHGTDLRAFVEPSQIDVRDALGIPATARIVSFVGRLVRENYVDDVLEVARRVGKTDRDVIFLVLGGGAEERRVRSLVAADPVLSRVVLLTGFRSRDVVAAVRQASRASLCLMGGFSLIEACAAGSPVIAYDVEWHHELVRDGSTGFLVAEHDVAGVAAGLQRLLQDPALAQRLGAAGRELAVTRHALEVATHIKRSCYSELIARAASA
jgi:glycosyltransferase involved in cell wall biosynthesis